jgi:formiminotetrahydrofolate cyclodeaminase
MSYTEQSLGDFAAQLGARTPAPASGAAIAVAAAFGAGLCELTGRFTDDDAVVADAVELRQRLLALADEDSAAYTEFMATKSDEARGRTIDVPLEVAELAQRVAVLAKRLADEVRSPLNADSAAAGFLARACVRAAARLVEVNAPDGDPRRARAAELAADA